jgi:lipopolysaccharide biosynthesis glycosyltransferase
MTDDHVIQLALAFDKGYLTPFYTLLTSIFQHNSGNLVTLHVIATGLTKVEEQDIVDFVINTGGDIKFYVIENIDVTQFVMPDHEVTYLSPAIYYRLFFPFLIKNVSRLLYIDVDTLVVGDLQEVFSFDMKGCPAAAVTDTDMPIRSELGIFSTKEYFNSGVLLIDIPAWKNQHITEKALQVIQEKPQLIKQYPDQDALNIALKNNWLKLPVAYNLMRLYVPNEVPKRQFSKFINEQKIIHYNGKKPWNSDCEHRLRYVYQQYARLSPCEGASTINKVKLSKEKRDKLLRSRLIEFYFDNPELMAIWRKLKSLVSR